MIPGDVEGVKKKGKATEEQVKTMTKRASKAEADQTDVLKKHVKLQNRC